MRRVWRGRDASLERRLRSLSPEAPDALVSGIASRIEQARPRRRAWSRVAFASAVTSLMVGMFASFGGLGYAAEGASSTVKAVKQITVQHKQVTITKSSAADQYGPKKVVVPKTVVQKNPPGAPRQKVRGALAVKGRGQLPFTGLPLLVSVLLGGALVATGVALRRREERA